MLGQISPEQQKKMHPWDFPGRELQAGVCPDPSLPPPHQLPPRYPPYELLPSNLRSPRGGHRLGMLHGTLPLQASPSLSPDLGFFVPTHVFHT